MWSAGRGYTRENEIFEKREKYIHKKKKNTENERGRKKNEGEKYETNKYMDTKAPCQNWRVMNREVGTIGWIKKIK